MNLLGVMIQWPALAIALATLFAILFYACRRWITLIAALAWLAYFPYEQAMKMRVLCSGECNIRVDLLLLYPILLLISGLAVHAFVTARKRR